MGKISWTLFRLVVYVALAIGFVYNVAKLNSLPSDHFQQAVIFGIMLLWLESGEKKK